MVETKNNNAHNAQIRAKISLKKFILINVKASLVKNHFSKNAILPPTHSRSLL